MENMVQRLIQLYHLQRLDGEGGLFAQTYRSSEILPASGLPERYAGSRRLGTAILYLLTNEPDSYSAMHCLQTDEIYHFYLGDPVEMLMLLPGGVSQTIVLGPDVFSGQKVQHLVPAGVWQGSRLLEGGSYALIGTTMAPGYDPSDFRIGQRRELQTGWPAAAAGITRLIRK